MPAEWVSVAIAIAIPSIGAIAWAVNYQVERNNHFDYRMNLLENRQNRTANELDSMIQISLANHENTHSMINGLRSILESKIDLLLEMIRNLQDRSK
jgi:hypothetical protein